MSKFLTPPVWYDKNGNLVEILTGSVSEPNSIAIGSASEVYDVNSIAIGRDAVTNGGEIGGTNNIAIGLASEAYGSENIVIGPNVVAKGEGGYGGTNNIVIGPASEAYGSGNIVIGPNVKLGTDVKGSNYTIQIGKSNTKYTFKAGAIDILNAMHASNSDTFTGKEGGSGNYTVDFYRVGSLATLAAQVTFDPANESDSFNFTIVIPQEYRPSKNIQIDSVVSEPTATQIWNLLSNVSDNLAVGTIPGGGWIVNEVGYKTIYSNGQWTIRGSARRIPSSATLTMRCVYVI